jgi:tetratricopeptide (TPR) repeat protein
VPQKREASLAVALALVVSTCALAPSALGNRMLRDPAHAVTATPAPSDADASAEAVASANASTDGDTAQSEHKESGLVRVLAAPFRALARLFGGGPKKSKTVEAKKPAATAPSGDTTAQAGASAKRESAGASREGEAADERGEAAQPSNTPSEVSGAQSSGGAQGTQQQGARVVRPSDSAADAQTPRMWIPVIEGIPQDPLTQGRALLEHGYVQESIAELTIAAAQVGSNLAEANNLLGLAYDRMGWHTLAAEAYNRALTAAPRDPNVLANLGYSLYLADDYEGALRRLKQAAKLSHGAPVINNDLAIVEARLQKYDAAFKHFAAASNEYDAHLKLASILEDQKRDRDAIRHYEAALRLQPGTSAVLERLVALYERNGQHDKADQARRTLGQPKNPQKTTTGGGGG